MLDPRLLNLGEAVCADLGRSLPIATLAGPRQSERISACTYDATVCRPCGLHLCFDIRVFAKLAETRTSGASNMPERYENRSICEKWSVFRSYVQAPWRQHAAQDELGRLHPRGPR